ncbi:MAG: zinc ribbon domain-containing protein [Deltaproteobacteria bacterium]|nr:zinc ribbon domain-containing protein [Deltaproteobacteria bacterium]
MPIFEFRCAACGEVFEFLAMKKGEELELCCPHCGGEDLARLVSAANAVTESPKVSGGPGGGGASVENRSCANAGSCSTITLPGYER